jgi:hypothetical protein
VLNPNENPYYVRKLLLSVTGGILCSSFTVVPPETNTDVTRQNILVSKSSTVQINDPFTVTDFGEYVRQRISISVCNGYNLFPFTVML